MTTNESVLAEVNAESDVVEATRKAPPLLCRFRGHHEWGYALEAYRSKTTLPVQVCVRGRHTIRGRCPAVRTVEVPDNRSAGDGVPPAVLVALRDGSGRPMGMPRALREDWGAAAIKRRDGSFRLPNGADYQSTRGSILEEADS